MSDINNLNWNFSNQPFEDFAAFEIELRAANDQIPSDDWKPNAVAAEHGGLLLQYMCDISSPKDLLENEFLSEADRNTFQEYPDQESHQVEVLAKLSADNTEYFTMAELLYKAHNQLASKQLGDHVFFEEVGPLSGKVNGLPVLYISAGS